MYQDMTSGDLHGVVDEGKCKWVGLPHVGLRLAVTVPRWSNDLHI